MATRNVDNELTERFVDAVSRADDQRLKGLNYSRTFLDIRQNALMEQRKWLAKKYGDKYPGLVSVDRELASGSKFLKVVKAEIAHTRTTPSEFDMTGWRVHGRVFDKSSKPVKGAVIELSSEGKKTRGEVSPAETDENGYYSIILDEKQVHELNGSSLFLVLPQEKKIRKSADFEFIPKLGESDYLDIQLSK